MWKVQCSSGDGFASLEFETEQEARAYIGSMLRVNRDSVIVLEDPDGVKVSDWNSETAGDN